MPLQLSALQCPAQQSARCYGDAQARLRNTKLRCCLGEPALLRDREEGDKIVQISACVPRLVYGRPCFR